MTNASDGSGKWGKGKTDPATWFTKGCKPGPGRPKGAKNKKSVYVALCDEKVVITKDGKKATATKGELKYLHLVNKAAAGDMKAIAKAIELDDKFGQHQPAHHEEIDLSADLATLEALIALQQQFTPPTKEAGDE